MKKDVKITKFISKINFKKALKKLSRETILAGPVRVHGEIVLQNVGSVNEIVFDYENCLNTPKDYMFLNDETLFRYDLKNLRIQKNKPIFPKTVIFGARACDTKAIDLLDKFFSKNLKDPLYFNRRDSVLIITLVCQKLWPNCFCTSTHSGPYLEDGFDIQLVDINNGYFLEAASEKGKGFVKKFSNLMSDIDKTTKNQKEKIVKMAMDSKRLDFNLKKVYNNLDSLNTKEELWRDLAQRCQSCGGCLLICPTCSCFYVIDKKINDKEGQRVRSLDTCFYEGFTRMAGDYNPVIPKSIMMRRKFYHKLWQQINEFSESGCTGCGRCNEVCPGNINWLQIIKKVEKNA